MKNINKKIQKIYERRNKAYDEILKCDIEIDKILHELTATLKQS